jgi:predicted AlkP superfamily pyrophosphatase or phosphodiesterase
VAGGAGRPGRAAPARQAAAPARPRLIVLIVVDQFRGDYVQRYGAQWTGGLHEIVTRGAYFPEAAYPYAGTKTCAGHATIGTGTLPSTHGMFDNEWFDSATHEFTTCTDDAGARPLSYEATPAVEHHSARWMRGTTLADALLRTSPPSRLVSMSMKPRAAIGLGGHGGRNATFIWREDTGAWATSSAFGQTASPIVSAYVKAHAVNAAIGSEWTLLLPPSSYLGRDDAAGEPVPRTFPHRLDEPLRTSRTSPRFADVWEQSPLPDAYLASLAASLVAQLALGQHPDTDMLAISFSSLDAVGHRFGPASFEVQDTLARLDRAIGGLLAELDRLVGRDRYVLALSADHGVADLPEQAPAGADAGRLATAPVATAVENALDRTVGPAAYLEAASGTALYFRNGMLAKVRANPAAVSAVETAILGTRGVARMFWSDELASTAATDDEMLQMMRRSYVAGRSGDVTIVPKRNWLAVGTGATHGTPYDYDRRVPLAFLGAGIAPGTYPGPATPVDLAPTLAAIAGVALPRTDGRVLSAVIAAP